MRLQIKDCKRNYNMKVILSLIKTHSDHINKIIPTTGQTRMFSPTHNTSDETEHKRKRLINILKLQPKSLTTNQHFAAQQQYTYNIYLQVRLKYNTKKKNKKKTAKTIIRCVMREPSH